MKPRDLSTRERAIYDRLTLHARAALAPLLAAAARYLSRNPEFTRDDVHKALRDLFANPESYGFPHGSDLAGVMDRSMGGL